MPTDRAGEESRMAKLARLSLGMLALAVAIAAPLPARARAVAPVSPVVAGRLARASATDPNTPGIFRWHLENPHPCVRDSVVLVVAGFEPTACDTFLAAFARTSTQVVYHTAVNDSIVCPAVLPRIHPIRLNLGLFPAGPQGINVEWVIDHHTPSGGSYTEVRQAAIDFTVSPDCVVFGRLPFVEQVQIGPPDGRTPPCIVPGDSIRVVVSGRLPNDCYRLVGIELLPDIAASPLPHAPRVRVTVDDQACITQICRMMPVPFRAEVTLPPLPPFAYKLPVEVARVSCRDSYPPGDLFVTGFPFVVADSCGARAGCILPSFGPGGAPHECDARVAPDQPARLTLYLRSSTPLAGLQGELALGDTALQVGALAPAGIAEGAKLRWEPTPHGAKFALIADPNVPLPPTPPTGSAAPVLDIQVVQSGAPARPVTLLELAQLVASDPAGREVPWCPTLITDPFRFTAYARICSGAAAPCDFNGDGHADIRDLVLMMRCLRDGQLCGDSTARFDCNQDQVFTIDDILCCAEGILAQDCPGCPPGETRDTRDVKLTLGPPMGRMPTLHLPFRIEGAGGIGGARLALRFPDDRYDVTGVEFGGAAASWLHVSQVSGGRVLIGLIDPDAVPRGESRAVITLGLALKPGAEPGGEVTLEGADLSARDGVKLAAPIPLLRQPLGNIARLELSENRPNPFAAATRFSVTLTRPGPVDIGIFDLGGRRLFTVHHGDLPAGTREFAWDGRLADGSRAQDGVYFYRVDAGTETLARKLVLLRSP
jgi:flagellar hook capping protein FlgD